MIDIVKQADTVMKQLMQPIERVNPKTGKTYSVPLLTTSQIRKFLVAVNAVTNKINAYKSTHIGSDTLPDELAAEVKYLKVKIVYQAGREVTVRKFVQQSKILEFVDRVGNSLKQYEILSKYVEALVAYHKFYGGKDNG